MFRLGKYFKYYNEKHFRFSDPDQVEDLVIIFLVLFHLHEVIISKDIIVTLFSKNVTPKNEAGDKNDSYKKQRGIKVVWYFIGEKVCG